MQTNTYSKDNGRESCVQCKWISGSPLTVQVSLAVDPLTTHLVSPPPSPLVSIGGSMYEQINQLLKITLEMLDNHFSLFSFFDTLDSVSR